MFLQQGATPLHLAVHVGDHEMIKALVAAGATFEAKDKVKIRYTYIINQL